MTTRSKAGRFFWSFSQLGAIRIAAIASSFLLTIILTRALGADGYGLYVFTLTIFMILEPLAGGGLGALATRDVATHDKATQGEGVETARMLYSGLLIAALISIIVVAMSCALGWLEPGKKTYNLWWGLLLLPAAVLVETSRGILAGQLRIVLGQLLTQVIRTSILIVVVGGVWFVSGMQKNVSPATALTAMGCSGIVVGLLALWANRRPISTNFREVMKFPAVKLMLKLSLPFAMLTAFRYLNTRMDIIMVGTLMTPVDVGHYQVAVRLGHFVTLPASLVAMMLAPKFAKLNNGGLKSQLRELYLFGQIPAISLSLLVALLLLFAGPLIVKTAFGEDFAPAAAPLMVVTIGQALICFNALSAQLLVMAGREKKIVLTIALTLIGNFLLNLLLIPIYGIVGAAIATSAMAAVTVVFIAIILLRSGLISR